MSGLKLFISSILSKSNTPIRTAPSLSSFIVLSWIFYTQATMSKSLKLDIFFMLFWEESA